MVLTRSELIASLQNEVRILLHLAGKVDRAARLPADAQAAQHDRTAEVPEHDGAYDRAVRADELDRSRPLDGRPRVLAQLAPKPTSPPSA